MAEKAALATGPISSFSSSLLSLAGWELGVERVEGRGWGGAGECLGRE